jgi:hypothetical protein
MGDFLFYYLKKLKDDKKEYQKFKCKNQNVKTGTKRQQHRVIRLLCAYVPLNLCPFYDI